MHAQIWPVIAHCTDSEDFQQCISVFYEVSVYCMFTIFLQVQFVVCHTSRRTATDILLRRKNHKEHSKNIHEMVIKTRSKSKFITASYSPEETAY